MTKKEEFLNSVIVVDTETDGVDYTTNQITELGYAYMDNNLIKCGDELFDIEGDLSPEVSAVTNITKNMLEGKAKFVDRTDFYSELVQNFTTAVAHNSRFNQRVIEKFDVPKVPNWLCTFKLAKKIFGNDETFSMFNLPYLRYRLELQVDENVVAHRAGGDAYVTMRLLQFIIEYLEAAELIDDNKDYLPQLNDIINAPLIMEYVPFGKHKDEKFVDVPISYWEWCLANMDSLDENNDDFDIDLFASIEAAILRT